jgi:Ca-activated chloride channel family protein
VLERFERRERVALELSYLGSVDIMMELEKPEFPFDAVWPANGLWVSLGDRERRVKHLKSIMTSPVVFAVRRGKAAELGLVGKTVHVRDLLGPIREGRLRFMMTSATQSNSGASAYLGFLYALAGNPEVLTSAHLGSAALKQDIRDLLGGIHRSSGSSGWLKDLFLSSDYDAMVNYEAVIIETNQELERRGREPLHVLYPVDGIVLADSPLGFVSHGDARKEELFRKLQEYLLDEQVQAELSGLGRRTGLGGIPEGEDPAVFRPEWGIQTDRGLSPFRLPSAEVIREALGLYQSEFRKPSFAVYCLDHSSSMAGEGKKQLDQAMELLLDQEQARRYLLAAGREDRIVVLPFSDRPLGRLEAEGNDPQALRQLLEDIRGLRPGGSTDIYSPVIDALGLLAQEPALDRYLPAVVLMTDGQSNVGRRLSDLQKAWSGLGRDIPVFAVMFGSASRDQLEPITELARGRLFDGRQDLAETFRTVRGYH